MYILSQKRRNYIFYIKKKPTWQKYYKINIHFGDAIYMEEDERWMVPRIFKKKRKQSTLKKKNGFLYKYKDEKKKSI